MEIGDCIDFSIVQIIKNTEKSPGNLEDLLPLRLQ